MPHLVSSGKSALTESNVVLFASARTHLRAGAHQVAQREEQDDLTFRCNIARCLV